MGVGNSFCSCPGGKTVSLVQSGVLPSSKPEFEFWAIDGGSWWDGNHRFTVAAGVSTAGNTCRQELQTKSAQEAEVVALRIGSRKC